MLLVELYLQSYSGLYTHTKCQYLKVQEVLWNHKDKILEKESEIQ